MRRLRRRARERLPRGLIHGWPGVAFALVQWYRVTGFLPDADYLVEAMRAMHPYEAGGGWKYGSAGMALLFARAYQCSRDQVFRDWAIEAAAKAVPLRNFDASIFLGGCVGTAYCLLAVDEIDRDGPWRDHARDIAVNAISVVEPPPEPYGVWGGLSGLYCLTDDLLHDTRRGFPGIES
jgi:hypothetical protein